MSPPSTWASLSSASLSSSPYIYLIVTTIDIINITDPLPPPLTHHHHHHHPHAQFPPTSSASSSTAMTQASWPLLWQHGWWLSDRLKKSSSPSNCATVVFTYFLEPDEESLSEWEGSLIPDRLSCSSCGVNQKTNKQIKNKIYLTLLN